jgi:hypothetical protein
MSMIANKPNIVSAKAAGAISTVDISANGAVRRKATAVGIPT